jgi:hypothetical protein
MKSVKKGNHKVQNLMSCLYKKLGDSRAPGSIGSLAARSRPRIKQRMRRIQTLDPDRKALCQKRPAYLPTTKQKAPEHGKPIANSYPFALVSYSTY